MEAKRWLPVCVLGQELKSMECDNTLVNNRLVSKEIFDVEVNLLNVSPSISQKIKALLMEDKHIC